MDQREYSTVSDYSYFEYCEYLKNKYKNVDITNTHPTYMGTYLFKHHFYEFKKPNIANNTNNTNLTEDEKNTIILCDYLEHLFLHILIGEQTDARKALGIGGAVHHILPQIREFLTFGNMCYAANYYNNIDPQLFKILANRCERACENIDIAFDHNLSVYLQAENYLDKYNRALVVIGTGLGKTSTALEYLVKHKCRGLVIVPNRLIKNGWEEYSDYCDVVTYQSFANTYLNIKYNNYGLIILDEAHHIGYDESRRKGAARWGAGIQYIIDRNIKVLGLTATPLRSDKIDIRDTLFDNCVCEGFTIEDGIKNKLIYPFSYITAYYNCQDIADRYAKHKNKTLVGKLNLAINNTPTVKDIFKKHMPNTKRKGIVFIQDIADMNSALKILKESYPDIEMRVIHSKLPAITVESNRTWFEQTDEGYLVSVNMISEGAHYSGVNTLIMFRRTSSYLVFSQQLGRIITLTRNADPHAIVFDLVNNIDNIDYSNITQDEYNLAHTDSTRIISLLKTLASDESNQLIVADETRDIVSCIYELKKSSGSKWREDEDQILYQYWETDPKQCKKLLPYRDCASRAQYLGLKSPSCKSNMIIRDEELEIIKENYSTIGSAATLSLLNSWRQNNNLPPRTLYALSGIARRLNVKAKRLNVHRVICIETGDVYENASEAARITGIKRIDEACRSGKSLHGYHWRYEGMDEI